MNFIYCIRMSREPYTIVIRESITVIRALGEGDTRPSKRLFDRTVGTDLEAWLRTMSRNVILFRMGHCKRHPWRGA